MTEQDMLWGLIWIVVGLTALLILIALHEHATARPIEWDQADGDWPHTGDRK
jgi:hypothetical protein